MSKEIWKTIFENEDRDCGLFECTSKMKVDSGYIYKTVLRHDDTSDSGFPHPTVSMVFVPKTKRSKVKKR